MTADDLTCEQVDARDLDTRYLAGTLSADEAEAFELHYFGCDRCWALVQQGSAVRAALGRPAAVRAPATVDAEAAGRARDADAIPITAGRPGRPRPRALSALLAAAAIIVVVGLYQSAQSRRRDSDDAERGAQGTLSVSTSRRAADSLVAAWPHVVGAVRYRSRMFTASGDLIAEHESPDTFAVALERTVAARRSTRAAVPGDSAVRLFWSVEALDSHGVVIAKSSLTAASEVR